MEIFQFVENSFDFDLINKCKAQLGSKSIKKINTNLRDLVQSDIPTNNFKITIDNEKINYKKNNSFEECINNKQLFDNYEKENTTSGAENTGEYLSD